MLMCRLRVLCSRTPLRNGFCSCKSFQSRGYTKEARRNLMQAKKFLEDKETGTSRPWLIYIIPTAMAAVAGAVAMIKYNDEKRAILKGSNPSSADERNRINRPAIGGPFKLFDTKNNLVTDSDFRGNWVLIYFGYTSSPDVGPDEVQKMAKAINILESEHNLTIKPVFITIDPQRDTPDHLQKYLSEFDPRIEGLTGPINAIRQIAQEYRVYFKKVDEEGQDYLIQCSHNMYLLDRNMEIVKCFGVEYDASELASAIVKEMSKTSK